MDTPARTFTKTERLCGKNAIAHLLGSGRWGSSGPLRYCILTGNGESCDRLLISVPKKLFKRAVRRNLLKRRIRESYRLQKELLGCGERIHCDILIQYNRAEILPSGEIKAAVAEVLRAAADTGK